MTESIGPGRKRNKALAVCVAIIAAFPLFLGFSVLWVTRATEWPFPLLFLLPGIGLLAWAAWLWTKPQGRGAAIEFTADGFKLVRLRGGESVREADVDWQDVRELREISGGYGVRGLEILLTHAGARRAGLVLKSTRDDASDFLVRRKLTANGYDFDLPVSEVVQRCLQAAEEAGFHVEKAPSRYYFVVLIERWVIKNGLSSSRRAP